ncbi:Cytochrome P450 [Amycolatopsis xylanica]|uniref:Cytochrome P450 n=1 Tax=Amycolatopsis xylanica TaxID=589385 RepID=A0A1H3SBC8_9PSEU|nr:cytochrome P450 [Amycolatopsis xylanica]SDZ34958.1 Cytochrome P450 [Amycolatopsis xylanica]
MTRADQERRISTATASVPDTLRVAAMVAAPTIAVGIIKRRPHMMALAQTIQADRAGIRLLRRLRAKYGDGPLRLRVPGRSVTLPLAAEDVGELLAGAPHPFSPATREKKAALGHFQPNGVLISEPPERAERRRFNETVLEPGQPLHELAAPWAAIIRDEAASLRGAELDWTGFDQAWWRVVRRVVLGGDNAADREVTDLLDRLRLDANWAYARPPRRRLRERFLNTVRRQVGWARPDSLAAKLAKVPGDGALDPAGQVPHWLFAFDAAGIVTFRALALLATHPVEAERACSGLGSLDLAVPHQLPYLRACVLESVRLWPTTPALLRESRVDTEWGPDGTTEFVYTPFFHRDSERLPYADRFEPEIWLDGRAQENPALVPFSAGPAICPGRDLVLFTASTMLANLLRDNRYELRGTSMTPGRLPATVNNFGLRFESIAEPLSAQRTG